MKVRMPSSYAASSTSMIACEVLEAHRLGARLLLRHVVHAEELVVAEEDSVHDEASSAP